MTRLDRLAIDAVISAGILLALVPSVTGMALHEVIAVAIIVPCLVHMIVNWDWGVRAVRNLATKAGEKSRVDLAIDVALFVSAVTVMLSGFMVSAVLLPMLGIAVEGGSVWRAVHSFSADATFVLSIVHLARHWMWIADTFRGLKRQQPVAPAQEADLR